MCDAIIGKLMLWTKKRRGAPYRTRSYREKEWEVLCLILLFRVFEEYFDFFTSTLFRLKTRLEIRDISPFGDDEFRMTSSAVPAGNGIVPWYSNLTITRKREEGCQFEGLLCPEWEKKGFCVLVMGRILLQFFFLFVWLKAASMSYTDVRFLSDAYFSHSLSKERVADRTFILSGGSFFWSGQEFVRRSTAIRLFLSYPSPVQFRIVSLDIQTDRWQHPNRFNSAPGSVQSRRNSLSTSTRYRDWQPFCIQFDHIPFLTARENTGNWKNVKRLAPLCYLAFSTVLNVDALFTQIRHAEKN